MISKEEVEGLAKLARLELSGQEIESLQQDISKILDYVGQLQRYVGAPTEASGINSHIVPLVHNVMRDDAPRKSPDSIAGKEAALRAAFPQEKGGYNVVRKIIQKD